MLIQKFGYTFLKVATDYRKRIKVGKKNSMKYIYFILSLFIVGLICCKKGVVNNPKVPTVTSNKLISSTYSTYTVGGTVIDDGGALITERGICYKVGNNPTINDAKVIDTGTIGQFSITLNKLLFNTNYTYKAYAINSSGVGYGAEIAFTTGRDTTATIVVKPTVNINQQTIIGIISGYLVSNGGGAILNKGFCYSRTKLQPDLTDSVFYSNDTTALFTDSIINLYYNTIYHVVAFATNAAGTSYSNAVWFESAAPTLPVVTTISATANSYSSGIAGGSIVNIGGAFITEKGVSISNYTGNTMYGTKVLSTDTGKDFSVNITNLLPATTYYVSAYAINAGGVAYGKEMSFTTQPYSYTLPVNLTGNFLKQKTTVSTSSGTASALYCYDSLGRLTYYKSDNPVLYSYLGNSIYPTFDGVNNYYKYDNISNNLLSDSIIKNSYINTCTFNNTGNTIDGSLYQYQHMQGGYNAHTYNNHIEYINNNVSIFNYSHNYRLSAPQQLQTDQTNYYNAQYTYTTYLNPEYSIKAIIVMELTSMNSYWNTSNYMPLTENNIITDVSGNKTSNTSIYTYTLDMMGRVVEQKQTISTGEIITTDYVYY